MSSLTRVEARVRRATVQPTLLVVELDLRGADQQPTFPSLTTLRFGARAGSSTFVDVAPERFLSARLNGRPVPDPPQDGRLTLSELAGENELVVEAEMAYRSDGEGLHRHVDPADQRTYLYAMSFLDAAPRWFACFDQPDLKTPVTLRVRAPKDWTVLGNGPARRLAPGSTEIVQPLPVASYATTLVAGPWASVLDEHEGTPLGVHARASLAGTLRRDAPELLSLTRAGLDVFARRLGSGYAFGEYHQVFVPDFNAGAMENPGCVTLRDQLLFTGASTAQQRRGRTTTVLHELAHMWFGNLVTMSWWDDLWLNESFAEQLAHRACAEVTEHDAWADFGVQRKAAGSVADQAPSTHPVAGNGCETAAEALGQFDAISYSKGAAVLGQLASHLGEEVFWAGLADHLRRHRHGNAELADLLASWTRAAADLGAGDRDLPRWQRDWLARSGMDLLRAEASPGERWTLTREAPGDGSDRVHSLAVAGFDAHGREVARYRVRLGAEPLDLDLADAVWVVPDAEDESWARIRAGGRSPRAPGSLTSPTASPALPALTALSALPGPARRVGWNALRDQVWSGEIGAAEALQQLHEGLGAEPSDVVVATLLEQAAGSWTTAFTPPAERAGTRARLAELVERLGAAAEPGSDRELDCWRVGVGLSTDVEQLQAWAVGHDLPGGRPLDELLAWPPAVRLAALGRLPPAEEVAERFPTSLGRTQLARCRAAVPSTAAKSWALSVVLGPTELSAYEVYGVADGLFLPDQHELCVPFAEQWLDRVAVLSEIRSGWSLSTVVNRSFPGDHVRAGVRQGLDRLLAGELDPTLRRALLDRADALGRAWLSLQRHRGAS